MELTSSEHPAATLGDVPGTSGAVFVARPESKNPDRFGLFGAPPLEEGYVVLVGDENLKQFPPPSEFLLSVWDRSRAARLVCCRSTVECVSVRVWKVPRLPSRQKYAKHASQLVSNHSPAPNSAHPAPNSAQFRPFSAPWLTNFFYLCRGRGRLGL